MPEPVKNEVIQSILTALKQIQEWPIEEFLADLHEIDELVWNIVDAKEEPS